MSMGGNSSQAATTHRGMEASTSAVSHKYSFIGDNFRSVEEVTEALRGAGLESSNLIVGIDFTKSNEWTGRYSFHGQSLHTISNTRLNPYEQSIQILGNTLSAFDDDNLIPCFGFGDVTTGDHSVFSFHANGHPCHGFEEVLTRYREIVPHLRLSGPTSFAPIIKVGMDIVEQSGGQYHVLLIIADGQVTRSPNRGSSPQEQGTIDAIVEASGYALSIVLVGVGDGPWESMKQFDDRIPHRTFDNFQFVNFTDLMARNLPPPEKEAAFALAALMEIPSQYKAAMELGILNQKFGSETKGYVCQPPYGVPNRSSTTMASVAIEEGSFSNPTDRCPVCLQEPKDMAFQCGHQTCRECASQIQSCPICRQQITTRLRLFS